MPCWDEWVKPIHIECIQWHRHSLVKSEIANCMSVLLATWFYLCNARLHDIHNHVLVFSSFSEWKTQQLEITGFQLTICKIITKSCKFKRITMKQLTVSFTLSLIVFCLSLYLYLSPARTDSNPKPLTLFIVQVFFSFRPSTKHKCESLFSIVNVHRVLNAMRNEKPYCSAKSTHSDCLDTRLPRPIHSSTVANKRQIKWERET